MCIRDRYDDGERYTKWSTSNGTPTGTLIDSIDNVLNAIADGIDNDGDSDDFEDLNSNGIPDYIDENQNSTYDEGDILEPGVKGLGGQNFVVFAILMTPVRILLAYVRIRKLQEYCKNSLI